MPVHWQWKEKLLMVDTFPCKVFYPFDIERCVRFCCLNYIQSDLQQVFVSQNFGTLKIQNRILERSLLDNTLYFCQGNITPIFLRLGTHTSRFASKHCSFWSYFKNWDVIPPASFFTIHNIPCLQVPMVLRFPAKSGPKMRIASLEWVVWWIENWGFFLGFLVAWE